MLLEQKSAPADPLLNDYALYQSKVIEEVESCIDESEELYLFTWSPNPQELPNADFRCQHDFAMEFIANYLEGCKVGLACVESTQLGNPHYHGWYQVSDNFLLEQKRISFVKVLQKYGILKITKCKGHYRINSYTTHGNALHYYKKDLFGAMAMQDANPILAGMRSNIDPNPWWFSVDGKKHSVIDLENKLSNKKFYEDFYSNSQPDYKKN